ncbi:protein of unknown function [Acetitomaculum ruminis DSM 5522]|uniref:DUF4340 domain-containing protein n=1 Tax=Acetitomaculum ruminis DSM 5522 TaxID=1120918 RepID=A0A1I0Z5M3_9FIRM|nr:DUF4340 domain-containing protein [Acetitomaculum ruminis]SFB20915.1 protein of unknown function [Acetitomaculum ruminis DSM 5522]
MKKKTLTLIISLFFLVAFIAAYFAVSSYTKNKEEKETAKENENQVTLLTLESDDITEFSYPGSAGDLSFIKKDDNWTYEADSSIELSNDKVQDIADNFTSVIADRLVENDAKDLSTYGLESPSMTLTVSTSKGTTDKILIGDYNSTTGSYYAMINDKEDVYLLPSSFTSSFSSSVDDLKKEENSDKASSN